MVRPALLLVALACAPLLGGCRYTFVPLIPAQVNVDLPLRLTNATLERRGETLNLSAQVDGRFEPGFLTVRWFDGGRLLGSDSVYLDGAQRAATFSWAAAQPGTYRAVLSFGGTVLRQVELYEVAP
ncbi:hypothetical protein [Deinococcus knuensis]|uniref:Ig-like domain-containing protein n=1 Tax=Deinococcus knuensis TaxID=1837380 RepID=A0ABQ2SEF9_9DEIO|nr:hypothetical protein [Deinococcus knuensis]GGS17945.1 hypothetical protein GCM10008961_06790 [Deinococcus knuensis]